MQRKRQLEETGVVQPASKHQCDHAAEEENIDSKIVSQWIKFFESEDKKAETAFSQPEPLFPEDDSALKNIVEQLWKNAQVDESQQAENSISSPTETSFSSSPEMPESISMSKDDSLESKLGQGRSIQSIHFFDLKTEQKEKFRRLQATKTFQKLLAISAINSSIHSQIIINQPMSLVKANSFIQFLKEKNWLPETFNIICTKELSRLQTSHSSMQANPLMLFSLQPSQTLSFSINKNNLSSLLQSTATDNDSIHSIIFENLGAVERFNLQKAVQPYSAQMKIDSRHEGKIVLTPPSKSLNISGLIEFLNQFKQAIPQRDFRITIDKNTYLPNTRLTLT